jgi:uncharacterized membrane protein YqhA
LLVPFYIGLIAGVGLLLVKFGKAFFAILPVVFQVTAAQLCSEYLLL